MLLRVNTNIKNLDVQFALVRLPIFIETEAQKI
jgi:hypothetical protein